MDNTVYNNYTYVKLLKENIFKAIRKIKRRAKKKMKKVIDMDFKTKIKISIRDRYAKTTREYTCEGHIDELVDEFVYALLGQSFDIDTIKKGLKDKYEEMEGENSEV